MNTIRLNTIGDSPVVVKKGSQVQSQEKTVEITENGTTEVVPDAGYALSKVTVNTNVESGGGESTMEYLDVSGLTGNTYTIFTAFADVTKAETDDGIKGVGLNLQALQISIGYTISVSAVGISFDKLVKIDVRGQKIEDTMVNILTTIGGVTQQELAAIPRLTKEEFYSFGSEFVSIRDLRQPTKDEVNISAGVVNLDNLSTVKEIEVVEPTVYEEDVTPTNIALFNTAKDVMIALMLIYTQGGNNLLRLVAVIDSANSSVSSYSHVLFSISPDNSVQYDPEGGIQIVNDILASQDFKYIGEASGGELTEAQFNVLDKYLKVKEG